MYTANVMRRRLGNLILAVCYFLSFGFINAGVALADSRPYFRVYNGDVTAGGWFNNGQVACDPTARSSTYQAPTYTNSSNLLKGGIMAYGKYNSSTNLSSGAGSQFGAFALGEVQGQSTGEPYGFSTDVSGYNHLTFANQSTMTATNYWGGFMEGATPQTHCIPDYFSTKQSSPQAYASSSIDVDVANNQYLISPGAANAIINSGNKQVRSDGERVTIFVDGNAYIANNIIYASGYNANTVPKFALVARGSIFIDPSVTRLDGLYIAQPKADNSAGEIWTCHENTATAPTYADVSSKCRKQLVFNGSVISARLNLVRIQVDQNGGIDTATPNEASTSANIAEVFNYQPEMVIGGAYFNQPASGSTIQSIINLPPVF